MASNHFKQMQLDVGDALTHRPEHPGDLGFAEWSQRQDVAHHGTFASNWDEGNATHFGELKTARYMAQNVHERYNETKFPHTWGDYGTGNVELGEGRVHSRRLDNLAGPSDDSTPLGRMKGVRSSPDRGETGTNPVNLYTDRQANIAHAAIDYERYDDSSGSVRESLPESAREDPEAYFDGGEMGPNITRAVNQLNAERPIAYENEIEGGLSYVAKDAGDNPNVTSYEQDVQNSNRGHLSKQLTAEHVAKYGPRTLPVKVDKRPAGWQLPLDPRSRETNPVGSIETTTQSFPKPRRKGEEQ